MMYMVVVNRKYLVMVDASSAGGAEHRILDGVYFGIETAQAFTMAEMATDTFQYMAANCKTISLEEMKEKASCYKDHTAMITEAKAKIRDLEKQIERYRNEIAVAERNIRTTRTDLESLQANVKTIW